MWPNFVGAGARVFVLVRAVEQRSTIDAVRAAAPHALLTVVRLVAPAVLVEERLRRRDVGAVLAEHLHESERMARAMEETRLEDAVVANDARPIRAAAEDVLAAWGIPS